VAPLLVILSCHPDAPPEKTKKNIKKKENRKKPQVNQKKVYHHLYSSITSPTRRG
jgi:hypothetical protein